MLSLIHIFGALVRAMAGRCRRRDFAIAGIEIRSKGYRTIPALFGMMQVCCQRFCRSSRTMATVISVSYTHLNRPQRRIMKQYANGWKAGKRQKVGVEGN